jgi:ABC-type transport system involved in multi-copper enzyme maturation permease subunit
VDKLGLGPVFAFEWLRASRRWQLYAGRSLFVLLLFAALLVTWISKIGLQPYTVSLRQNANIGEFIFYAIVGTQLALVLLAAPAATASSVCLDKARGTLIHLMVTDLSNGEIVFGKLGARFLPVLGLVACSAPLLFICSLFGGIDPKALIGAFIVTLGVAILGSTLAITISVWGRKTYEVLLANYLVWGTLLLVYPVWSALGSCWSVIGTPPAHFEYTNPFFLAFAPYIFRIPAPIADYLAFFGICVAVSVFLGTFAARRVRAVSIRQLGRSENKGRDRRRRTRLPSSLDSLSLDYNPVLWREFRRPQRRWSRGLWGLYAIVAVLLSGVAIAQHLTGNAGSHLLFSVLAVTSIAEERVASSLDSLLTTPLTWTILWGKWLGVFRKVLSLAGLPTLMVAVFATRSGRWSGVCLLAGSILSYGAAPDEPGAAPGYQDSATRARHRHDRDALCADDGRLAFCGHVKSQRWPGGEVDGRVALPCGGRSDV